VSVTGTVSDSHLESVTVAGLPASLAGETFQAQVPLPVEGDNALAVVAVDAAGNSESLALTLERDTLAPEIAITAPGPSAVLAERTFVLTGVASDAHLESVAVDSQPAQLETDGAFAVTLTLHEGRHTVTVEAVDGLGHRASAERDLRIDLSAPEVVITEPEAGALLAAPTVAVTGHVGDPEDVERVTVNGVEVPLETDGAFTTTLELPEGDSDVIVRAVDSAGNSGVASHAVTVDSVAPSVQSVVPFDGATGVPVEALLRVTFSEPVDPESLGVAIALDSGGTPLVSDLGLENNDATVVLSPNDGLISDAEHRLEITTAVTDRAGHALIAGAVSLFRTSDDTPPPAPVVDPVPSPRCFTVLTLSGASEPGTTVTAQGGVRSASTVTASDGTFSLGCEPTSGDGAVTVTLVAVDDAGNASEPTIVSVELDCESPRVLSAEWDGETVIAVRLSETLEPSTVAPGVTLLLDDAVGPVTFAHTLDGADLELTLAESPQASDLPLHLELTEGATDVAGNPAVVFSKFFADPANATLVSGEVFSDLSSLELPGARIVLIEDGVPLPTEDIVVTSDGRGRFQLPVTSSPVAVRVEADGYVPSWRRVVPLPGASTLFFDTRLTPAAPVVHLDAAEQLTAGSAKLTVPAAAIPAEGLDVGLTEISEQGLPGLAPLGWRPLAAVHVATGEGLTLDAPATLLFAGAPPEAVIARFDPVPHAWTAAGLTASVDLDRGGTWALVLPDLPPTDPGTPVLGAVLPSALPVAPGDLVASLSLDPPVIMPTEQALATVEVTTAEATPSGLAVEALLDEVLHVVDGRTLVAPPSDTDLVLYQTGQGSMRAVFGLGATDAARRLPLEDGVRRVDVRALPEGVRTQDLLGPAGGTIVTPEGLGLDVPPGALDRVVGARLDAFDLDALPIVPPEGLEVVAAALLDLGETELLIPAVLSFPGHNEPAGQYLVLSPTEIDGATGWRLTGTAENSADRISCDPASDPDLPAPWVTGSGLYVLVRPTGDDWGLVSGTVFDVGGLPVSAPASVEASGGLVALVEISDGAYATAAPAGPVDLEAEHLVTRNLGATQTVVLPGEHQVGVDLQLLVTGPRVVATSPADGAVDLAATTPAQIDFSEPLDPSSVHDESVTVTVVVGAAAPQPWPGLTELSTDATRLTFVPDAPYPSQAQVAVTVSGSLRDLQGYPLEGGAHTVNFGVEHFLLPDDIDPSKILLYMPGRDALHPENPVVEGAPGAVPGNIWLWVEDLDHDAATTTVQAGSDGSFTLLL
ncbi:MAG: hypothetical protein DRJ61_14785, partial [Acidobacteria bacterium]